eukprot:1209629-Prymnesium_polylepis.1
MRSRRNDRSSSAPSCRSSASPRRQATCGKHRCAARMSRAPCRASNGAWAPRASRLCREALGQAGRHHFHAGLFKAEL